MLCRLFEPCPASIRKTGSDITDPLLSTNSILQEVMDEALEQEEERKVEVKALIEQSSGTVMIYAIPDSETENVDFECGRVCQVMADEAERLGYETVIFKTPALVVNSNAYGKLQERLSLDVALRPVAILIINHVEQEKG